MSASKNFYLPINKMYKIPTKKSNKRYLKVFYFFYLPIYLNKFLFYLYLKFKFDFLKF